MEKAGETSLLLFLFKDRRCLDQQVVDYFTAQDLAQIPLLSHTIRSKLSVVDYVNCPDGEDYLVPWPSFPGLFRTIEDKRRQCGLYQHQLASLAAMHSAEQSSKEFGALRGGILADAPGLGKTISILALISNTSGSRPVVPKGFWNDESIESGWAFIRQSTDYRPDILKAIRCFLDVACTVNPPSKKVKLFQLEKRLQPPFAPKDFHTIQSFQSFVVAQMRKYLPKRYAADLDEAMESFRLHMNKLKSKLDPKNRKLMSSPMGKRIKFERDLWPTPATLIVVPDPLLEHWFEQIRRHLDTSYLSQQGGTPSPASLGSELLQAVGGQRGVVYLDGLGDITDVSIPLSPVCLDGQMQRPGFLGSHLIVVTTFSRCEAELLKCTRSSRRKSKKQRSEPADVDLDPSVSPLLQLRWLRLVVDEGHELGQHSVSSLATRFITEIAAERRWVLSGTPTTGDEEDRSFVKQGLAQIQRLLQFLRHPSYGQASSLNTAFDSEALKLDRKKARSRFEVDIVSGFLKHEESARQRLLDLLKPIMVHHEKDDLELPKPILLAGEIDVPVPEGLLLAADAELGIAPEPGLRLRDTRWAEILDRLLANQEYQIMVDRAQAQHIAARIAEAKASAMSQPNSRPVKAVVFSQNDVDLQSVAEHLYGLFDSSQIAEHWGKISDASTELSRFRNNIRAERHCPICGGVNDPFNTRCSRVLLEVVDPNDSSQRFLIERERLVGLSTRQAASGARRENYALDHTHWRPGDLINVRLHPSYSDEMVSTYQFQPVERKDMSWWDSMGVEDCKICAAAHDYTGPDWFFGPLPENGAEQEMLLVKWQRCSSFHNSWYAGPTMKDADIIQKKEDVQILCLFSDRAHGLDLSFVTHIFLLEPIYDAALLNQVISRAHRLGATGPVAVETLHVWKAHDNYKVMEPKAAGAALSSASVSQGTHTTLKAQSRRELPKICEMCFRSFPSLIEAEAHEEVCFKNPDAAVNRSKDPFSLPVIYRDIKPPPAVKTTGLHQSPSEPHCS